MRLVLGKSLAFAFHLFSLISEKQYMQVQVLGVRKQEGAAKMEDMLQIVDSD